MKRKNAVVFSLIVILVSIGFSFLGINAALYGFEDLPVAGKVYSWVIHVKNSRVSQAAAMAADKNASDSSVSINKDGNPNEATTQKQKKADGQKETHKPDFIMEATAYVDTGQTKSQIYAGVGSVAVDPKVIPHGTLLYIEGYGLALATDTGRLIKGHSVDVWFSEEKKAREWGRKKVKVWKVGQADIKKILATGGKYVKY